ncbi:putative LACI-type transcriptional regulator [Klebsiella pneumoniae]|uniref:Putative LACI-type transcriptional regulator n=1 Tax=Klebsiella pneumoniae TaxID=573 RepID=A0A3S4H2M1_KLEPN|nr:putative LACI-type transcriptional regulator [Klebsiella pneumoniae]
MAQLARGRAVKEKRAKNKVAVYGMMIPSQAASLIKSGDITEGITYDPATARLCPRGRRQHPAERQNH